MRTWVWQLEDRWPDTVVWIAELGDGKYLQCSVEGDIAVSEDKSWLDYAVEHPDWWEELTS